MSTQNKNESSNQMTEQTIEINDLEAGNATEIKGGPKKIFIGGLSIADQPDPTPQTREHILLARQVGVPS
jgi:translation elongation factor EF-Tu-like GTPase